jgi:hypothetical protein
MGSKMLGTSLLMVLLALVTFNQPPALAQDETPPTIAGIRVIGTGEEYFELRWHTDEPTKGWVEYGRTDEYGMVTNKFGSSYETVHYLNVTGLKKGTLYHFRVYAEDLHGNVGLSGDNEVATFPYEEEGGLPWWAWTAIALGVIVVLMFLFFPRQGGGR